MSTLRDAVAGRSWVDLSDASPRNVREIVAELEKRFPGFGSRLNEGISILVNGRNIAFLNGFDTEVPADAVVAFIPPSAGG